MAEMGRFEVEALAFQCCKEGFNTLPQAVICQSCLGAVVGGQNQELAILKPSGDDVDPTAPYPAFA